jgi:hypothetical protein
MYSLYYTQRYFVLPISDLGKTGFEVLMAVSTKMAVFWVVGDRPDDGGSKDL